MKKTLINIITIFVAINAVFIYRYFSSLKKQTAPLPPTASAIPAPVPLIPEPASTRENLKGQIDAQLNRSAKQDRTLDIPAPPEEEIPLKTTPPAPSLTPEEAARLEGRKQRANLPMGVVLWDRIPVYESATGSKKIYEMQTGDFVRVFPETSDKRRRVQPGLDVYLAATTKEMMAAGDRLPDQSGWVDDKNLHVFSPEQAREFILEVEPVTLGGASSFSTLEFYERAMKNPDVAVHRVIGPRLIAAATIHEDYVSSWSQLYRDRDPKIRNAALSYLRERGISQSRPMIEDLIVRLTEITRARLQGESEEEALSILSILKNANHPRVPQALASFTESWKNTQGPRLNKALDEILNSPNP